MKISLDNELELHRFTFSFFGAGSSLVLKLPCFMDFPFKGDCSC